MTIKLLVADVDGTMLTKGKVLTPEAVQAVERMRAAGVELIVTSGRPPLGISMLVAPLRLTAPIAAFNGGLYIMPDLKTVISQRIIAPQVAKTAVDLMLAAGLEVWAYRAGDWFVTNPHAPRVARERGNVGFDPTVIPDVHAVLDAAIKLVGVSEDLPRVAACEAQLRERLGADASAARSQPYYLDVTHPEANKGMVLREAARFLKLPVEEVAAIGDMGNDVSMLSIAGLSIAMGNAPDDVKRVARHVTRSNEENGFAHAIDAFILGEPPLAHTTLGLPPRTRACVFGLDGVLIQAAQLHAEAWKRLFDPYLEERAGASGQPFVPFDAVHDFSRHFHGRPALEGIRSFLVSRGVELPEHIVEALADRKSRLLIELLAAQTVETYEGSLRFVEAAREAGLRTAVVSTSRHCRQALESAGIAGLFDARIDAAALAHLGPGSKPDAYLAAARAVGVDTEEAVVFEDELAGVEAARAGHFGFVVGVDRLGQAEELRRHGAELVVPDLAALLTVPAAEPPAAFARQPA
jgi:Cof subfamily protein (haloacid dehalogenase superfamily)/HAD superfamily hydrolase (TIGR01509 family)